MERKTINRRYRIDRLIGEGGMAEVYLGHDLLLNRPVAIKMLRAQYARDPNFRARFEREAQAAASFTHPNIIDIYDVGEEGETPYIVMEYGAGDNLQQIIEAEGPFDPDDVASLTEQVASALDYAHERGFVHRDIKPQNILVDEDGLAKVVDFGIAKGLADTDLTVAGTGLGTVHYVSPEQASGLMATPSSDIYSLAVVAYEMVTGQLPFDADTPVGIAMKHVNEPPIPPAKINPAVPRSVNDVIMRALAKDPTKRFPSASSFADALTTWRTPGQGQSASRQAAKAAVASRTTVNLPPAQMARATPAPGRVVGETWVGAPDRTVAARQMKEQGSGCTSWIVGFLVFAALAALLWFGFHLPSRLRDLGEENNPTATLENEVVIDPTRTSAAAEPTSPDIVPVESTTPEPVQVPALANLTIDDARATVEPLGLSIEESGTAPSGEVAEGQIIDQQPAAGETLPAGSAIQVTTSSGSGTVNIQDMKLFGLPADDAQALLEGKGLTVQRQEQASTEVPEGKVITTEPNDEARPEDTVTLVVSVGDKIQIPREIQGAPLGEAVAQLEQEGFAITDQIPVSKAHIESFGIDLDAAGIVDHDVVGVQDNGANFGAWLPPGTSISLVYYDASMANDQ
ncbi:MAG: Stk1 family PASTA domain-containing Ser/Thr kinase [Thermomicrobiales bacterium]